MKIVIVSDTHGSRKNIENVCECNPDADMLIHLGDVEDDADYIEAIFECPTHIVGGNNDFFSNLPDEKIIFIEDFCAMNLIWKDIISLLRMDMHIMSAWERRICRKKHAAEVRIL